MTAHKTVVIPDALQGLGAVLAKIFLDDGYNVGTSRRISGKTLFDLSGRVELRDCDVADPAAAGTIALFLADYTIAGMTAPVPMIIEGGLNAASRSLATKCAKQTVRANAIPPGVADTPQHANNPKDFLRTMPPIGAITTVQEIVDEIVHLMGAATITEEVLHVDYGARFGTW